MSEKDKASPNDCQLVNVKQLSSLLRVSERTIWRLRSAGKLPPVIRVRGSVRWKLSDFSDWIDGNGEVTR